MAKYFPISLTSRQIRLLSFDPQGDTDEPSASLKVVSLDDPALATTYCYSALSYAWGPETKSILYASLNGWPVLIRKNLWHFLKHVKFESGPKYLWIDALCIDQDNVKERNHQVALMVEIYSRANQVLVWLGLNFDDSDLLMDAASGQPSDPGRTSGFMGERFSESLRSWLNREYWSRTWIIQELLLGRKVLLMCGSKTTTSAAAERFVRRYNVQGSTLVGINLTAKKPPGLILLEQRGHRNDSLSLLDLIIQNRRSLCSDKHDRVFAMLGLAAECRQGRSFAIDYSMSYEELIAEVLRFTQTPAKDVCRYVHVLKCILEIDSPEARKLEPREVVAYSTSIVPPVAPQSSHTTLNQSILSFPITGQIIGRVTSLGDGLALDIRPHDGRSILSAPPDEVIDNLRQNKLCHRKYARDELGWAQLMEQMEENDLLRLLRSFCAIRSTSVDSRSTMKCSRSVQQPQLMNAILFMNGRVSQDHLASLIYGYVENEDRVVLFPGHDIGLILSKEVTPRATGTFICVNSPDLTVQSRTDLKTSRTMKYSFIHSPAESRLANSAVTLNMTIDQLLEFVN